MGSIIHLDHGGEKFFLFAKMKLRQMHANMTDSGVAVLKHTVYGDEGTKIYLNSVMTAPGVFTDRVRIVSVSSSTLAVLIDAALVPGVDVALLDDTHADYGLVLPSDILGLYSSFKAGGFSEPNTVPPSEYRGMIVNHAFAEQHPTEYVSVEAYVLPATYNSAPKLFRYFPSLGGGLFLSAGVGADVEGSFFTLTWIDGSNMNISADLGVTVASYRPEADISNQLISIGTPWDGVVGQDAAVGVLRVIYDRDTTPDGSNPMTGVASIDLLEYTRNGVLQAKIANPLPANSFSKTNLGGNRYRYTYNTSGSGAMTRVGDTYYLVVAYSRIDTTVDLQGELVTAHTMSSSLWLMNDTGDTLFTDPFSYPMPGTERPSFPQHAVSPLGVKVRALAEYVVPYTSSDYGGVLTIFTRSHLGTETLYENVGQNFSIEPIKGTQMDINSEGVPAVLFTITVVTPISFVKIWGCPVVEVATGSGGVCAWTPDGRYLIVIVSSLLCIFSAAGAPLYTGSVSFGGATFFSVSGSAIESVEDGVGVVTGSYKVLVIGDAASYTISVRTIARGGDPFSVAITQQAQIPPVDVLGLDDTRRTYV